MLLTRVIFLPGLGAGALATSSGALAPCRGPTLPPWDLSTSGQRPLVSSGSRHGRSLWDTGPLEPQAA